MQNASAFKFIWFEKKNKEMTDVEKDNIIVNMLINYHKLLRWNNFNMFFESVFGVWQENCSKWLGL